MLRRNLTSLVFDGHAVAAVRAEPDPAAAGLRPGRVRPGAPRPASLAIGPLDTAAISEIREILEGLPARPWISLTMDLTAIDDEHELTLHDLTLWVLLSQAAWKIRGAGSTLTVLNPPRRMAVLLKASPVPVVHRPPVAPAPAMPR